MMKKRYLVLLPVLFSLLGVVIFHLIFSISKQPTLLTLGQDTLGRDLVCYQNPYAQPIDNHGSLNVLVWNIYKQNRKTWEQDLSFYSQHAQLLLLQEANMTDDLRRWITEQGWDGAYVDAFRVFGASSGVLNLSRYMPKLACAYTHIEPWLRLPKSGIFAHYALSNGQTLAVVNLHAVNFTYGQKAYREQLESLLNALRKHNGPMIVAGDFNSWNQQRARFLKQALLALEMKEVYFQPDRRIKFMSDLPLDHVFYKGLGLQHAQAPQSEASDHNPMLVSFRL